MLERAIPRHEYEIFYNNEKTGVVTSGGVSPALERILLSDMLKILKIFAQEALFKLK